MEQECFKTACFFVDARRFYRKWLADMRDKQDADGSGQFPQFAPVAAMPGSDGGPGWSDAGECVQQLACYPRLRHDAGLARDFALLTAWCIDLEQLPYALFSICCLLRRASTQCARG